MKHLEEEKITQWFINNVNGTPSEEQLALRKVYEQRQEIERLNNIIIEAIEFIYENSYDEERETCIDDLWGEIPKLLDILKGSEKE